MVPTWYLEYKKFKAAADILQRMKINFNLIREGKLDPWTIFSTPTWWCLPLCAFPSEGHFSYINLTLQSKSASGCSQGLPSPPVSCTQSQHDAIITQVLSSLSHPAWHPCTWCYSRGRCHLYKTRPRLCQIHYTALRFNVKTHSFFFTTRYLSSKQHSGNLCPWHGKDIDSPSESLFRSLFFNIQLTLERP